MTISRSRFYKRMARKGPPRFGMSEQELPRQARSSSVLSEPVYVPRPKLLPILIRMQILEEVRIHRIVLHGRKESETGR